MNEVFSFGSYYPGDSPLHKCDARTKLTLDSCSFDRCAYGTGVCWPGRDRGVRGIPLCGIAHPIRQGHALARAAHGNRAYLRAAEPLRRAKRRDAVQWGIIEISTGSVHSCLFVGCRIILMMMGMSLITMTTTTLDLTAAVEQMLHPFARFGVPAHELGMIMGIALRFMPSIRKTELANVYHAQISRGAALDGSPVKGLRMLSSVTIPLFASVFRHAETLSAAMDARCYHGEEAARGSTRCAIRNSTHLPLPRSPCSCAALSP